MVDIVIKHDCRTPEQKRAAWKPRNRNSETDPCRNVPLPEGKIYMKRSTNKIWRHKLEKYISDLYFNQRKNNKEIAAIILKDKNISISHETIRKYISGTLLHENTAKNTEKQA